MFCKTVLLLHYCCCSCSTVCLSVCHCNIDTGYCQTAGRNTCSVRQYCCSITAALPAVLIWRSYQCVTPTWRNIRQNFNKIIIVSGVVGVIKWRRMRWVRNVARMEEIWGLYMVLVTKPEGKKRLGVCKRRWVNNITMELQEVGCGSMNWIELA
jgi:hypothetical protein